MQRALDWQDLRLFAAIARGGGLAPAARETRVSAATLGRRMTALETALGERLFERGARGYSLTRDGETLLDHVARMEAAVGDIARWRSDDRARQRVRISAGGWTTQLLVENLAAYWSAASSWVPEFVVDFARRDVGRREIDIGIRNGRPVEPWLAGRRVGTVEYAIYRSAAVAPDTPIDGWIGVAEEHPDVPTGDWGRERHGAAATIGLNMSSMGLPLVRQGLARMAIPCFIGDAHADLAREGGFIDEFRADRWLVVHQDHRHRAHVRAAIEALAGFFTSERPGLFP